jgi:type II secretory pathway pseudopilin PulG
MKIFAAMPGATHCESQVGKFCHPSLVTRHSVRAFTMIEIALCLAIIGFALIAVIAVLPYGMGTQRDNRQETLIGQDANLLLELIRNGSRGADDLTNYVFAITNSWTFYNADGSVNKNGINGYTFSDAFVFGSSDKYLSISNGARIVGLLSTPEFYTNTVNGLRVLPDVYHGGYSNHVVAYVRSVSGLAAEKPPQDNSIMQGDAFTYRLFVVNAPLAQDSNLVGQAGQVFNQNLDASLHELRLTFLWPQLPNGNLGNGRQTFRTSVAGDLKPDPYHLNLFFYQPQSFTATPP